MTSSAPTDDPRVILEAIAELHRIGYGRLKLFCYVKEGVGAWRHWLFASDEFPESMQDIPEPLVHGSIRNWMVIRGATAEEAVCSIRTQFPEILAAALGKDDVYTSWFSKLLNDYPTGTLEMESRTRATVGSVAVPTPYA